MHYLVKPYLVFRSAFEIATYPRLLVSVQDILGPDNILHRGQTIAEVDDDAATDIGLDPGEASPHHGWLIHGSNPNPSRDRCIGLTIQYLTPKVRQRHTDTESATLVRGADRFGHFRQEPVCQSDFDPDAVAFQKQAEQLKYAVYDTED